MIMRFHHAPSNPRLGAIMLMLIDGNTLPPPVFCFVFSFPFLYF